jgi:hypothetical protein
MNIWKRYFGFVLGFLSCCVCRADDPASRPAGTTEKLPHVHVDLKTRQVVVDCEALNVKTELEFFCVIDGGNEHESVLRTPAKPSDIHFALLMLGLTPGSPATFLPSERVWVPPHGPPLHISCRYLLDGKSQLVPAYRMMRSATTHKEMPPTMWVFDGSRVMPDGLYAADMTGYVVSICNFDLTMIDVPSLVSNSNDTLEWEFNPDLVPPKGTAVEMIIEPASEKVPEQAPTPADKFNPGPGLIGTPPPPLPPAPPAAPVAPNGMKAPATQGSSDESAPDIAALRQKWDEAVAPHRSEIRAAAAAHYQVIAALRARQQKLVDQADQIQRTIDELEKDYQDMTTPGPDSGGKPGN